ncbi:MAG: hypothetical protein ABI203_03495 [Mucilaginibacter sp.]
MRKYSNLLNFYLLLFLFFTIVGCKKIDLSEGSKNQLNFIASSDSIQTINSTTARIGLRIFANSKGDPDHLLPSSLFYIDTAFGVAYPFQHTVHEISRKIVKGVPAPVSLLVLIDKSVVGYGQSEILGFEKALIDYYKGTSNYEINIAGFANNNSYMSSPFQPVADGFRSNISQLKLDSLGFLFDIAKDGGTPNLSQAINSGLDYINTNAHNANRAIVVLTNFASDITDTASITTLTKKAALYNTSINLVPINDNGPIPYSQLRLVRRTKGMVCYFLFEEKKIGNNFDLAIAGLNNYLTGGSYYKSVIEVTTSTPAFSNLQWALFRPVIDSYNSVSETNFIELLYEK